MHDPNDDTLERCERDWLNPDWDANSAGRDPLDCDDGPFDFRDEDEGDR